MVEFVDSLLDTAKQTDDCEKLEDPLDALEEGKKSASEIDELLDNQNKCKKKVFDGLKNTTKKGCLGVPGACAQPIPNPLDPWDAAGDLLINIQTD